MLHNSMPRESRSLFIDISTFWSKAKTFLVAAYTQKYLVTRIVLLKASLVTSWI